jgi:hypothetical protein
MKQLYTYVYRSEYSEIILFNDGKYRLLCYDVTRSKEAYIMELFKKFMIQTNSVEVHPEDPLDGMSWFSGDFSGDDNLSLVTEWVEKEMQWTT